VALVLVVWGVGTLLLDALRLQPALGVWLDLRRQFRAANATTRLVNSPLFSLEHGLGLTAIAADRAIPLRCDAELSIGPGLPEAAHEEARRRVGYVLAPRRVVLGTACTGSRFAIRARGPGCDPSVVVK
jgi:hypothetical protein